MQIVWGLTVLAGMLMTANLSAAPIVQFQVADLGGNLHSYNYSVSGFVFLQNQELAISFDSALYGTLSNGVAGTDFSLLLLQPNNPPGVEGDYSALALISNPSLAGPFRIDFIFKGAGVPATQAFSINQYDQNGNFLSTVASGVTTPLVSAGVPEPGGLLLCSLALVMGGILRIVLRRSGSLAQDRRPS